MMESEKKIIILIAIISSVESIPIPSHKYILMNMTEEDYNVFNNVMDNMNGQTCPPFGKTAKFEVETIQTKSPMYGCAYMGNKTNMTTSQLFHLWLERPVETTVHGHCNNMQNMDHFIFECVSKNIPTNKYEVELGWQYISLLEHATDQNKAKERSHRCALYDMRDIDDMYFRVIRMVISKPMEGPHFNESQCKGLSELLGRDELPYIPEGLRYWPDGSMYLYLLGRKAISFMTTNKYPVTSRPTTTTGRPSTTTTTSRPSTTTTTSRPSTTTTTSRPSTTTTTRRPSTTITTTSPTTTSTTKPAFKFLDFLRTFQFYPVAPTLYFLQN